MRVPTTIFFIRGYHNIVREKHSHILSSGNAFNSFEGVEFWRSQVLFDKPKQYFWIKGMM